MVAVWRKGQARAKIFNVCAHGVGAHAGGHFRAGYDFLLLRCASGEIDADIGVWWTAFYEGDEETREALLVSANAAPGAVKKKRPPRRSTRSKTGGGTTTGSNSGE